MRRGNAAPRGRTSLYFDLLDGLSQPGCPNFDLLDGLSQPGCPICRYALRAVAQHAIDNFSALEADLSELIRKSDYRFRWEPRGPEASSWQRAAHLVAGGAAVRWPLRREPRLEG